MERTITMMTIHFRTQTKYMALQTATTYGWILLYYCSDNNTCKLATHIIATTAHNKYPPTLVKHPLLENMDWKVKRPWALARYFIVISHHLDLLMNYTMRQLPYLSDSFMSSLCANVIFVSLIAPNGQALSSKKAQGREMPNTPFTLLTQNCFYPLRVVLRR